MNCEEVQGLLGDRRDDMLDADTVHAVDMHLNACEACCRENEELTLTLAGLRALRGQAAPQAVRERVLQNIKANAAANQRRWRPARFLARAAAVLVVGAVALLLWHSHVGEPMSAPDTALPYPRAERPKAAAAPRDAELSSAASDDIATAGEFLASTVPAETGPEALGGAMMKEGAPTALRDPMSTKILRERTVGLNADALETEKDKAAVVAAVSGADRELLSRKAGYEPVDALQDRADTAENTIVFNRLETEKGAASPIRSKDDGAGAGARNAALAAPAAPADEPQLAVHVVRVPVRARQQTGEFIAQLLVTQTDAPAASARSRDTDAKQAKAEAPRPADSARAAVEQQAAALDQIITLTRSQFAQLTAFLGQVQIPALPETAGAEEVQAAPPAAAEADTGIDIRQEAAQPEAFFDLQIQVTE